MTSTPTVRAWPSGSLTWAGPCSSPAPNLNPHNGWFSKRISEALLSLSSSDWKIESQTDGQAARTSLC